MRPDRTDGESICSGTRPARAAARLFAAAVLAILAATSSAWAESAYCNDLKARIVHAGQGSGASRYRAAAAKQQREIARTAAYSRSLGCDRQQFLFFGDPPPPQCGGINARLVQMQANLAGLERGGSGEDGREALIARYNADCGEARVVREARAAARAPRTRNIFEEFFGAAPPDDSDGLREVPVVDPRHRDPFPDPFEAKPEADDDRPSGGSMAICVRTCDGGYFPVSYSARRSNLEQLDSLCKALCPNADAALYTKSPWKNVGDAVSIDGQSYGDHPNALKFQKTYDAACGCKPRDKNWADSLEDAERMLAAQHSRDIVISAERAEQLSQPIAPGEGRGASRQKNVSTRQDAAAASEPLRPSQNETGDANPSEPSIYRETVGPDGVKRRVRVVAPSL